MTVITHSLSLFQCFCQKYILGKSSKALFILFQVSSKITSFHFFLVLEIQEPVGHIATHDRGVSVTEKGKLLVPPHNTRYVSWGHKDLSVRAGNYESDRPTQVSLCDVLV